MGLLLNLLAGCSTPASTSSASATGTSIPPQSPTFASTSPLTPAPVPMTDFLRGISFVAWSESGFARPESDYTLSRIIKPMGVTWVAIIPTCFQETITSTQIKCEAKLGSPNDKSLLHAIQYAKSIGLRVMLKPHLDNLDAGHWRGEISMKNDADWQLWFASYTDYITHYAKIAQDSGADYFVVGTELDGTHIRPDDWRKVIQTIRTIYPGPLTYASNHDGGETSVTWWDALDAIGVDAYYPLTGSANPTIDQLKTAWEPQVALLESLSLKWDRPVIFTEAGYQSTDGTNREPWGTSTENGLDLQEQADCYQALIETFGPKGWWQGIFWWGGQVEPTEGGLVNQNFSIYGKPAEDVVRAFYDQAPHPTTTPIPNYIPDESNRLVIYDDALGAGWENWSWATALDLASTENILAGKNAIKVTLTGWTAVSFHHLPVDTTSYEFLEFYIFIKDIQQDKYPHVSAFFFDRTEVPMLYKPDISLPAYVEGGDLTPGAWHQIRIPLAELGIADTDITMLALGHQSNEGVVNFYLDDISLVGAR